MGIVSEIKMICEVWVMDKRFEIGTAWVESPTNRLWFLYDMVEKERGCLEIWISSKSEGCGGVVIGKAIE